MGKNKNQFVTLAVLALVAFFLFGQGTAPSTASVAAGSVAGAGTGTQAVLSLTDTTVTGITTDPYAGGSAQLDVERAIQLNGVITDDDDQGDDPNWVVNPGQPYSIWAWDDQQTTAADGSTIAVSSTEYYGYNETVVAAFSAQDTYQHHMAKSGVVTVTVNNDNGTVNQSGTELDLAANDRTTGVEITLKPPADACAGAPESTLNLLLVGDFNNAAYDLMSINTGVAGAGVPSQFSATSTGYQLFAQDLGITAICDNKLETLFPATAAKWKEKGAHFGKFVFNLTPDVSSLTPVDAAADINFTIVDSQVYFDSTNGTGFQFARETVASADIGQTNTIGEFDVFVS